ncbi:MAG TPA: 2-dehydropantoate 2-reductase [Burkholderiales bacterium]|nr:2-dehydropantoate 2-reductase [Burkholderiales bacterium]
MKIAMMGSGGVGGLIGARLAHAGCDVSFIARGAHLAAMREHGLKLESQVENVRLRTVQVTDDPATLGQVDIVIFSVKLWDTDSAARQILPLIGPETGVISLQNGVVKDDILRPIIGEKALMGGVAYMGTAISRPGVIQHTGTMQRVVFGEYSGRRSKRAEALLEWCRKGGLDAAISDDIRRTLWEKFVFLVAMAAVTATIRLPIGPIRSHPMTRKFYLDALREAAAVGRAHGIRLPEDFAEERMAFVDTLPSTMTASMQLDLERGNPLEVEWLSGSVVELGAAVGVPTPVHRAARDILILHAQGRKA